ncbi:TPA: hypothetical protein ACMSIK_001640 [Neisseria gonorrhoeae]
MPCSTSSLVNLVISDIFRPVVSAKASRLTTCSALCKSTTPWYTLSISDNPDIKSNS